MGGFGASMVGHNHPSIQKTVTDFLESKTPMWVQGSKKKNSEHLAQKLTELAGGSAKACILTNSGAETVEAAMKHASLWRQKREKSFRVKNEIALCKLNKHCLARSFRLSDKSKSLLARHNRFFYNFPDLKTWIIQSNEEVTSRNDVYFSFKKAFHGKTNFAKSISAFGRGKHNISINPHEHGNLPFHVKKHTKNLLIAKLNNHGEVDILTKPHLPFVAFFIEPIQGEAGIIPISKKCLQTVREFCTQVKIPLVNDEIQSGMYRTGKFLALQHHDIEADYTLLSKSLGGSFAKIGALLISENQYLPEFSLEHSSTFSEDELSSEVALKTIEILERTETDTLNSGIEHANGLKAKLCDLQKTYPDIIKTVTGKGLMIGLELSSLFYASHHFTRIMYEVDLLVPVIAGYLLHEKRLRVMPTLNRPNTFRIEPSMYFNSREVQWTVEGLEHLCKVLRNQAADELTKWIHSPASKQRDWVEPLNKSPAIILNREMFQSDRGVDAKIGFLCHMPDYESVERFSPSLKNLNLEQRARLCAATSVCEKPSHMSARNIRSPSGKVVSMNGIGLVTSSMDILQAFHEKRWDWIEGLIGAGVNKARELDCNILGLGQFISIVTHNGTDLSFDDMAISSGNSLTAACGLDVIRKMEPKRDCLAVVGAAGNVCEGYLLEMAHEFDSLLLIGSGRETSTKRLETIEKKLNHPNAQITSDMSTLTNANVIVTATSAIEPVIFSQHVSPKTIICDLAVPRDVDLEIINNRKDVTVIRGGVLRLPFREEPYLFGIPFESGTVYACMAETMLMGMRGYFKNLSYGDLTLENIAMVRKWYQEEGFELITNYS